MQHEMGRPRAYIAQFGAMDGTNIRMTNWHRRMARKIDRVVRKTQAQGEISAVVRWLIEEKAVELGLTDLLESPIRKNKK